MYLKLRNKKSGDKFAVMYTSLQDFNEDLEKYGDYVHVLNMAYGNAQGKVYGDRIFALYQVK